MASGCVGCVPNPSRYSIAMAIALVAKVRAALQKSLLLGAGPIVALPRILFEGPDAKGIGGPFPTIAAHIVKPKSIWLEGLRRSETDITVDGTVVHRELTLPDVTGRDCFVVRLVISPRVDGSL